MATLFPMLYAAIMSRLLYQLARWKLEKSSSLGTLEQLMGSRTLGAALVVHFQLQSFNILAFALFFGWAFSPLGS